MTKTHQQHSVKHVILLNEQPNQYQKSLSNFHPKVKVMKTPVSPGLSSIQQHCLCDNFVQPNIIQIHLKAFQKSSLFSIGYISFSETNLVPTLINKIYFSMIPSQCIQCEYVCVFVQKHTLIGELAYSQRYVKYVCLIDLCAFVGLCAPLCLCELAIVLAL